ncbi:hypothetical protein IWW57_003489 [Coemansia sp. S610]|uniref:Uncharacterized protein n=1 Tax=Coemansia linderi TaxID=2663919 RepID=A0ACC1KL41_9FUNG|nr:hypothetical protein IWW57_003489 [Coemansia sp. S610]KAJ2791558.1 hypothetical protein GGI18_001048 [Coemansia linderi]
MPGGLVDKPKIVHLLIREPNDDPYGEEKKVTRVYKYRFREVVSCYHIINHYKRLREQAQVSMDGWTFYRKIYKVDGERFRNLDHGNIKNGGQVLVMWNDFYNEDKIKDVINSRILDSETYNPDCVFEVSGYDIDQLS